MIKIANTSKKTNLVILLLLNTSKYRQWLILAYFICKMAFKSWLDLATYYNNYIYNHLNISQVPMFELHNITAKLAIIYEKILKYSKIQLFAKCKHSYTINQIKNLKMLFKQALECEIALNSFAIYKWPENSLANIKFLFIQRKLLAKMAINIITINQLYQKLLPVY